GDWHRTDQARPSSTEWPPRTHASHLEKRSHQTSRSQLPAAAGPLRRLHRSLQQRTSSPSLGHEVPGRGLSALTPPLHRTARYRLSVPRQDHRSQPAAAASVWGAKKLTSARSSLAKPSVSRKFTTISGW